MIRQSVPGILLLCVATAMSVPTQSNDLLAVSSGIKEFSTNIYKILGPTINGNYVASPLSTGLGLLIAYYGARGTTAEKLKEVLHIPQSALVNKPVIQEFVDRLSHVGTVEFRSFNKIFTDKSLSVKPEFKSTTATYFNSPSQSLDFLRPNDAATAINNWAKNQTNNKIQNLVEASDLQGKDLVLVNAVHFKGNWEIPFNATATKNRPFHVGGNTFKQVPTMYSENNCEYIHLGDASATLVVFPYKNDDFSLVIILPDEGTKSSNIVKNLDKIDIFQAINKAIRRKVRVYLPKFKIESKLQLREPLTQLGLGEIFSNNANFFGISDRKLKVSNVVQKTFIEVNEEGSEAAAATGAVFLPVALFPTLTIDVNRPFAFAIIKRNPNILLFGGRVVDPTVSS